MVYLQVIREPENTSRNWRVVSILSCPSMRLAYPSLPPQQSPQESLDLSSPEFPDPPQVVCFSLPLEGGHLNKKQSNWVNEQESDFLTAKAKIKKSKFLYLQLGVDLGSQERDSTFLGAEKKIGSYPSDNGKFGFLLHEYIKRITLIDSLDLNG